jgi:hypothetical protein
MNITIVTLEDLEKLKSELKHEILQAIKESGKYHKKWLKSAQVRKMLGISENTLISWRVNGLLPYTKVGGTIFYDMDDVNAMMQKHKTDYNQCA